MVKNLSWSQFTQVMAPKIQGAWHLHELSQHLPLDFFVCFSSMASLIGNPGQGNYAAANGFMDALIHYRRGRGLPGLSINWGPWRQSGMATSLNSQHQQRIKAQGITALSTESGLQAIGELLSAQFTQVGVMSIDWGQFVPLLPPGAKIPLLEDFTLTKAKMSPKSRFREQLEATSVNQRKELLITYLSSEIAKVLGLKDLETIEVRQPLFDLGLDSLMAVELKNRLESGLGVSLPSTLLFDYPNIETLGDYVEEQLSMPFSSSSAPSAGESNQPPVKESEIEPIAIIGMGCRFPGGVNSPDEFWNLLSQGIDSISEVAPSRWDIDAYYDSTPQTPGKISSRWGGFITEVDRFDAEFFGIAPREAVSLDPQQRLLLEVSWQGIENANQSPENLFNSLTGVFIGISTNDYARKLLTSETPDAYFGTGNAFSAAAGRLSYTLGLKGPSLAVETACSSSLVAVHLACQSLRHRECNLALAGGVNLLLSPETSITFSQAGMLSPDGRCHTFAADANGYVRGEGCGVIVLKRLSDALSAGDNILAVIRGSAVNQDGASGGLTVPNGPSQEAVIHQALNNAQISPEQIGYIEAHGTGTSLGDPIEVRALGNVFGKSHSKEQPLTIGSVKTNIGHLEAAAGIAGLIKVVLQLQHQRIAPHLHFHQPNPYINWDEIPVSVPREPMSWQPGDKACLAGVSSFGFSGTNAHVIVEQAPLSVNCYQLVTSEGETKRPFHLLTLSAKTELALVEQVERYHEFLGDNSTAASSPSSPLGCADICFSANVGRSHFNHRLAIIASDQQELTDKLALISAGEETSGVFSDNSLVIIKQLK